jgi:uncharacterized membrane protein YhiD involved in acid resistance
MAAGAGAWVVAVVTTVLILISLGPLNWLISRSRSGREHLFRLRVQAVRLEALGAISRALIANGIEIGGVNTQQLDKGRYEIELHLRPAPGTRDETVIAVVSAVPDIEILDAGAATE